MTSGEQRAGAFAGGAVSTLFPYRDRGHEACFQHGGIPRSNAATARSAGPVAERARYEQASTSTTSAIGAAENHQSGLLPARPVRGVLTSVEPGS
jgi:hypothetical protein